MKGILAALVAALVTIGILFYGLYGTSNSGGTEKAEQTHPKYHVQVITQNSDEHFWTMFKKGASAAGTALNTYVEFVDIAQKDTDTSVQAVEKAIFSKVDGVALQAQDITKTSAVLETAKKNKIAAVTFENELGDIPDVPIVSSNSYAIGQKEGEMGVEVCNGNANVAVIVNGAQQQNSQYKNLKLQGILHAFSAYSGMKVQNVYSLNSGMFEIEKLMNTILAQNPKLNLIICTDERSTPGVVQMLVDTNKLENISVVGYGAMPQTLKYIKSGVIYGAVCPDAYQIGYQTVAQLCALLDKKQVTESLNTELITIDRFNADKYMVKSDEK